ncbi:MRG-domain-containing protein [Haematococcus lacustris]
MAEALEPGRFVLNEKVYVPHTDKFYEAKILKVEYRGATGYFYFVHYTGWNKKFDEWIEEGGLVKADVAEAQQQPQQPSAKAGKKAAGGSGGSQAGGHQAAAAKAVAGPGSGASGGGRKAAAVAAVQAAGPPALAPAPLPPAVGLDLDIPPLLKKLLVEDYDCVSQQGRLLPLPRCPCVADVLRRYVEEAKEGRSGSCDAEEEVAAGLQAYFDKSLLALLLYRQERGQAAALLSDGRLPSSVYGVEHLARLLSKLAEIMPLSQLSDDQLACVATMVQDVMAWLVEGASSLFLTQDQYLAADPSLVA